MQIVTGRASSREHCMLRAITECECMDTRIDQLAPFEG